MQRLKGVHPDLVKVVHLARDFSTVHFIVVEGVRTLEKQREYFSKGKSKTMKSRHLTGHAVDLAPFVDTDGDGDIELSWAMKDFRPIAIAMKAAGMKLGVSVEWGGDWLSFVDAPHFQLNPQKYPA